MALRCYMAMTAAEFDNILSFPENPAWMACQFSSYGAGLSNLPQELPPGAMVMLNDHTPVSGHSPKEIAKQLYTLYERLQPACFLLDFQRPGVGKAREIIQTILNRLPCPVAVSHHYAENLDCPVFLPPPPLHLPLKRYLEPWKGREIWLETTAETQTITITHTGSHTHRGPLILPPEPIFTEESLACKYHTEIFQNKVVFTLFREKAELKKLQSLAQEEGVALTIGFYQELK